MLDQLSVLSSGAQNHQEVLLSLAFNESVFNCTSVVWMGDNISGQVPREWGALQKITWADLHGNQKLHGLLPFEWVDTDAAIITGGTQLVDHVDCNIDCFSNSLTDQQRDKCGVWYQMKHMELTGVWLPPCERYIMGRTHLCLASNSAQMTIKMRGISVSCNNQRVVALWALLVYDLKADNRLGACTSTIQLQPAKEVGAIDYLSQLILGTTTFSSLMQILPLFPPPSFDSIFKGLKCIPIQWSGSNLSARIPQEWGNLKELTLVDLSGYPQWKGDLPAPLLRMQKGKSKVAMLHHSPGLVPRYNWYQREKLCKQSQGLPTASMVLVSTGQSYIIDTDFDEDMFKERWERVVQKMALPANDFPNSAEMFRRFAMALFPLAFPSPRSPSTFFCGKNTGIGVVKEVALLWSTFLLLLVMVTALKVWQGKRRPREGRQAGVSASSLQRVIHQLLQMVQKLHLPLLVLLTFNDLITDILLASSMFPSWTSWVVLGGLLLPDAICTGAITINGMSILRQSLPTTAAAHAVTPIFSLITFLTLPLLVAYLVVEDILGRKQPCGSLLRYWWGLDIRKIATLMSGTTACTEDLITVSFTSMGYVVMATAPYNLARTNIYFAPWAFWLSLVSSMIHMLVAWWGAVGNLLEHQNLTWVVEAFRDLYRRDGSPPGGGPSAGAEL